MPATFHHAELPNGLTVLGEVNPNALSAAVGFFIRTGARDEAPELSGCTHFLEHMMFKGTDRRTTFDINREFDEIGASNNAFTSNESTVYHAALLPEFLPRAVDLLADMMRPALRPADFDTEKQVILNEIAKYLDQPESDVMEKAMESHFAGHPLGQSVLGTRQSVSALTRELMLGYFNRRYGAGNITVACTGRFDFAELVDLCRKHAGGWERGSDGRLLGPAPGSGRLSVLKRDPEKVSREHITMLAGGPSEQDPLRFAADVLTTVIGDRTGSRFYWALITKGLVEDASMWHQGMDRAGLLGVYINAAPEKAAEAIRIVQGILGDVQKNGVTEPELNAAKIKHASAEVISSETPSGRLFPLGGNWLYRREYRRPEDDLAALQAVSRSDIRSVLEQWPLRDLTITCLGPLETIGAG